MSQQLLHQEDQITPRSALRHRPIHPAASTDETPRVPRASRWPRTPRDTKRTTKASLQPGSPQRAQRDFLFFVGIGMLLALVLVVLVHVTLNWISVTWDDVHYGRTGHVQDCGEAGRENIHVYHAQRSWPVSGEITVKRQPLLLSKVAARQCFPGMYLMDLYVTRWICQKGYIFFASLTVRTVQ